VNTTPAPAGLGYFKMVIRMKEHGAHGSAHRFFDWMRDPPGTVEVS